MGKKYVILVLFVIIFSAHIMAQFVFWSFAQGNAAINLNSVYTKVWSVISLPLFGLLSRKLTNELFWFVFICNSLVWALVCSALVGVIKNKLRLS